MFEFVVKLQQNSKTKLLEIVIGKTSITTTSNCYWLLAKLHITNNNNDDDNDENDNNKYVCIVKSSENNICFVINSKGLNNLSLDVLIPVNIINDDIIKRKFITGYYCMLQGLQDTVILHHYPFAIFAIETQKLTVELKETLFDRRSTELNPDVAVKKSQYMYH
ncbi:hypothetical protein FF38_12895 [Lucilia cuprina]|uniref:Uncharacterized protein n=1 Tax=Lucilia cuprina TaxID=7375 RepID=A0A0L0C2R5_LUCCU|nr:hypothetical protein FF38_12895 [Lucilia cuprina]